MKAKHCFDNFKKRYLKKKNALKKVNRSGTSSSVVEKAKKDLDPYLFFSWYDDFTRPRASKANVPPDNYCDYDSDSVADTDINDGDRDEIREEDENGSEIKENEQTSEDQSSYSKYTSQGNKRKCSSSEQTDEDQSMSSKYTSQGNKRKSSSSSKRPLDDPDLQMMKEMVSNIKKRRENAQSSSDAEDIYCQSLAAELRQFSPLDRCLIKREFNETLFNYQMKKFSAQSSPNFAPGRIIPSSTIPSRFSGGLLSPGSSESNNEDFSYMNMLHN